MGNTNQLREKVRSADRNDNMIGGIILFVIIPASLLVAWGLFGTLLDWGPIITAAIFIILGGFILTAAYSEEWSDEMKAEKTKMDSEKERLEYLGTTAGMFDSLQELQIAGKVDSATFHAVHRCLELKAMRDNARSALMNASWLIRSNDGHRMKRVYQTDYDIAKSKLDALNLEILRAESNLSPRGRELLSFLLGSN